MRALLVGGTGVIGRALAANLISAGHQVWILSRHPEAVQPLAGATIQRWDGRTPAGWENLAVEADALVNLAGENIGAARWTRDRKERILRSRLDAGNTIVEAIWNSSAGAGFAGKVLIQASAVGYYGPSAGQDVTEETPPGSDYLSKICIAWEDTTKPVEDKGIRRVIIRTGLVLSLAGGVLPRILLPFRLFVGGPVGSGRQWYSWIHIQDEVEAIRYLLEHASARGAYNLTAPNPLSNADLGRVIARVCKRPYWAPVPAFALRLALGEMSTLILDGQKVLPQRLLAEGYSFQFPRAEAALKNLITDSGLP